MLHRPPLDHHLIIIIIVQGVYVNIRMLFIIYGNKENEMDINILEIRERREAQVKRS